MRRLVILAVVMTLGLCMSVVSPAADETEAPREVRKALAIVGTQMITASDVDSRMAAELAEAERTLPANELAAERKKIRDEGLNILIEEKLLTLEGRRLEKESAPLREWADRQVETILKGEIARQGGQVTYENQLAARKTTIKQERERIRDYVLRSFVMQRFVGSEAYASPGEIRDYYEKHLSDFQAPREVAYRQIFIPAADFESAEKARQQADWIRRNMAPDGHDFGDWVTKYSKGPRAETGGAWAQGEWSTTDEKLQQQILALTDNEISQPLEGPGGFYIFKIDSSVPAHAKTLLEAQTQIGQRILAQKRRLKEDELISRLRGEFAVRMMTGD
jgi:peptidyl-prolyl cis-trans isomerase SurA